MGQRKLQVWGRENIITSQVKQMRIPWWRWMVRRGEREAFQSRLEIPIVQLCGSPRSQEQSALLLLLLLLLRGQTSGRREGKEVTKRSREDESGWKKEGWGEVRRKKAAMFILETLVEEGAGIAGRRFTLNALSSLEVGGAAKKSYSSKSSSTTTYFYSSKSKK